MNSNEYVESASAAICRNATVDLKDAAGILEIRATSGREAFLHRTSLFLADEWYETIYSFHFSVRDYSSNQNQLIIMDSLFFKL